MGYTELAFLVFICTPGLYALNLVPQNPVAVGSNVTLGLNGTQGTILGSWLFGPKILLTWFDDEIILGYNVSNKTILFDRTSHNLTLLSVSLSSSGVYAVQFMKPSLSPLSITLDVQEPVGNVNLFVSKTNLVETNDSVTFTCSASGTPVWFTWMNNNSVVTAGGRFELNNRTNGQILTINGVTRNDEGPFKCIAYNSISETVSDPINLNISYGPSNLTITTSPEKTVYISGSNITLSCSADSKPAASFYWTLNGLPLNVNVPNNQLTRVTQTQTGEYSCTATNAVTLRYTTVTKTIKILDPISAVVVNPAAGYPIENMSFSLGCDVVGPEYSILWMKNGMNLDQNERITFSNQNLTLNFTQLFLSDNGNYSCIASNAVSSKTSDPYNFVINYGPRNTEVFGPDIAAAGSDVTFTCSASSHPESQYHWYFNDSEVANSSMYVIQTLTPENSGQYTCVAFNNITRLNNIASLQLTVIVPVHNVVVDNGVQQPIFDQAFTLTCNAEGDVETIQWMINGTPLPPNDRITLSNQNATLSFDRLTLQDNGLYQCEVSNAVSNMTGLAYDLRVNYGPWNTTISGPAEGAIGSNVTFTCSANSYPQSQYSWFFNNVIVEEGSVYTTATLLKNSSGWYTCMAYNNITGSSNNASVTLLVKHPVSDAMVNPSSQQPFLNQQFNLTCSAKGDIESILWMKDGIYLSHNNGITLFDQNSTLSIDQLDLSDNGQYQCEVSNTVSSKTSEAYNLMVIYGPWNTTITGSAFAETGSRATFTCSANSYPQSQYSWFFNDEKVAENSVYTTGALSKSNSGLYTCMAYNNITDSSDNATVTLTVFDGISLYVSSKTLIPVASQNLQLTCNVNGTYSKLNWLRNNQPFNPSATVLFTGDNTTVNFQPLQTSDNGKYQCVATNTYREYVSEPYNLTVNYGPQNVEIFVQPGIPTILMCRADSQPPAVYKWILNNNTIVGNEATISTLSQFTVSQNYTCMATNPLTGVTVYTSFISDPDAAVSIQASVLMTAVLALLLPVLNEWL